MRRRLVLLVVASCAALAARGQAQDARGTPPEVTPQPPVSGAPPPAESTPVPTVRKPAEWNLGDGRLAIDGYDPVAYFPEGGGAPTKGDPALTVERDGAVYRFTTAAHRALFTRNPARYEPAFGGWCAYAMGKDQGEKVEVDPESFLVTDGRLLLFYDGLFADTRSRWIEAQGAALGQADGNWKRFSGEDPRLGGQPQGAAPDFELKAAGDDAVVRLSELKGQVVVLCFEARWSEPSARGRAVLQPLAARFAGRPLAAFAIDCFGDLSRSESTEGPLAPIAPAIDLYGGDIVARQYGVEALPTFVVVGADGTVVNESTGLHADVGAQLATMVEAALAAQPAPGTPAR